jgi:hypothetical protein
MEYTDNVEPLIIGRSVLMKILVVKMPGFLSRLLKKVLKIG